MRKERIIISEINQSLVKKLVFCCNILAMEGQNDVTLGHVSARLPGQEQIYMKPAGLGLEEVKAEDIIIIDLDGKKVAGEKPCHLEYPIHTEVYRARTDINCVIHTHALYATALGAAGGELRPISREGLFFMDLPLFTETTELIVTKAQGQAMSRCLGSARAILLQNHGSVVVGQNIEEATIYAILLESAARLQYVTQAMGEYVWTSEEESRRKLKQVSTPKGMQGFWDYYVRKLNAIAINRHIYN